VTTLFGGTAAFSADDRALLYEAKSEVLGTQMSQIIILGTSY